MNNLWRNWQWPIMILISVGVVIFFTFVNPGTPVQGIAVLWFVALCPGMSLVPLLKLDHFLIEVTLAIALSLSIDAIVVGIFLYSGYWSPPAMLWVLIALSLLGSILQLIAGFVGHSPQGAEVTEIQGP
jgi:hypothetical protein